ncbi:MAG: hypothetical protein QM642_02425 [Edaphocola sp.]
MKRSKHINLPVFFLAVTILAFMGCGKTERELTPQEIQQKADSIYRIKLKKIQQNAAEDYKQRLPIELKPKIDSILKRRSEPGNVPSFPNDNVGLDDTNSAPPPFVAPEPDKH